MLVRIETVLYLYMAACLALAAYNFFYMYASNVKKKTNRRKTERWEKTVLRFADSHAEDDGGAAPSHFRQLTRNLSNVETLVTFSQTLELIEADNPGFAAGYMSRNYSAFQYLAVKYSRKENMERAYFADFISRFPPCKGEHKPIIDTLLLYLDNSTVYCRENVLRALLAIGNIRAVETMLSIINDRDLFHHQKLIGDGLVEFSGDKQALAAVLWSKHKEWEPRMMLAVVQFITTVCADYAEPFLTVLEDSTVDMELRLAIMRYYRRHPFEPVRPILLRYLKEDEVEDRLAIVAATVLDRYEGEDTESALIGALSSQSWHVRYNASAALVAMNIPEIEIKRIMDGKDRYAKEILAYRLEQKAENIKTAS